MSVNTHNNTHNNTGRLLSRVFGSSLLAAALVASAMGAHAAQLTVNNGSGSGLYSPSTEVHIWANPTEDHDPERFSVEPADPQAPLRLFDRWAGDVQYVTDEFAEHTTMLIPAGDVQVTATYKDAPRWIAPRVITYFPPVHQGVIFLFHGGGGSAAVMVQRTGVRRFVSDAVERGYAVVAIDSFDRREKVWDHTPDPVENVDMNRVAAVRSNLIASGKLSDSDSVYVLGASSGGQFVSLLDQSSQALLDFPIEAAAIYIAPGFSEVLATSEVPTIFLLAQNDGTVPVSGAELNLNHLLSRGVPAQLWVNPPSPVFPERLWQLEGLSQLDSLVIHEELEAGGFLDASDYLQVNPELVPWPQVLPAEYEGFFNRIADELRVAYAEHMFMGEFNGTVLDFFEGPSTLIPYAPLIAGFSPGSALPGAPVIIDGEGFFDVVEVTFGGVPASFITLSTNQIRVTVPPGAVPGPITVSNDAGTATSAAGFAVPAPKIDELSPQGAPWGSVVSITGSAFVDVDTVQFNGVNAPILGGGPALLRVQVPEGATTGPVTVSNYLGTAVSPVEFVVPPPVIGEFSPDSGGIGATITVSGDAFLDVQSVTFGGVAAQVLSQSQRTLRVRVPEFAATGPIAVTTPLGTTQTAGDFTVYQAPIIAAFAPNTGPVGTEVTLSGLNFSGATSVSFAGVEASFVVNSDDEVVATVPDNAASGLLRVQTPGGTAVASGGFRVR